MVESCCHRRGTERTEWISDQIITFNGLASVYSSLPTEFVCRKGSGWQENEKITKICAKVHGENVKRNRLSIGPGKGMKVRCKGCWGKRGEKKKNSVWCFKQRSGFNPSIRSGSDSRDRLFARDDFPSSPFLFLLFLFSRRSLKIEWLSGIAGEERIGCSNRRGKGGDWYLPLLVGLSKQRSGRPGEMASRAATVESSLLPNAGRAEGWVGRTKRKGRGGEGDCAKTVRREDVA